MAVPAVPVPPFANITYEVFKAAHISTNTTTNINASGEGLLYSITINTKGATGNTATITIDGATMAILDTTSAAQTIFYVIKYYASLAITTATGTAADLTVSYL